MLLSNVFNRCFSNSFRNYPLSEQEKELEKKLWNEFTDKMLDNVKNIEEKK